MYTAAPDIKIHLSFVIHEKLINLTISTRKNRIAENPSAKLSYLGSFAISENETSKFWMLLMTSNVVVLTITKSTLMI